jgi:polyferredoxin
MRGRDLKNVNIRQAGQWLFVLMLTVFWVRTIFDKRFFFDFEACCPFGGLQAISTYIYSGALACSMDGMQVVMGIMLALSVVIASKLFCGHVCPVGTVSEGIGRLGRRLKIKKFELRGIADMAVRSLKYILLFIVFYFTLDSNDLFCKKFDPFFATVTLFGEDVSAWMASGAIVLLLGGGIFLKQFWCRYLCPLGALSSAFKYFYVFIAFGLLFFLFRRAEIQLSMLITLAVLAVVAYSLELIGLRKRAGLQLLKIRRDAAMCIDCGICDSKCPQGIKVSQMEEVNHPDCNLCTECMGVCPDDQAVSINGRTRFRWLPTLITVALIMIGLIFGANLTIPTVDMKWGSEEELNRSAMFEMTGLKHVKCYGSSMSFVDKMKEIPGITGTATYIKDHRVQVMYDSTMMDEAQVRRSIFTPKFLDMRIPESDAEVMMADLYIENFFDELDVVFIANLAKDIKGVYSFETIYGQPVRVRFYVDESVDLENLADIIEGSDLVYSTVEESFSSKGLYTVSEIAVSDTLLSGGYLKSLSFPSFQRAFNNRSKYSNDELGQVVIPIEDYPRNTQLMPYVVNHLGHADPHIVGLIARYASGGPVAVVFYVKGEITEQEIVELITMEKLTITYDNGFVEEVGNPYVFRSPEKKESEI